MEDKIKEILYKYSSTMTIKGVIDETDEWLWEGEFNKIAQEIVKLFSICKHETIISSDGLDECTNCGARNY